MRTNVEGGSGRTSLLAISAARILLTVFVAVATLELAVGEPPEQGTATISGTVTDQVGGGGVEGIDVAAVSAGRRTIRTKTAADGTYRLENLPKGTWAICVASGKDQFAPWCVEVAVGGTDVDGPIFVRVSAGISGLVTNPNGGGLSGVRIVATRPGKPTIETRTALNGTYTLKPAANGAWTIWAFPKDGYDFTPSSLVAEVQGRNVTVERFVQVIPGFLFKDGVYVPPPYDVQVVDKGVKINGLWARKPPGPIPAENLISVPKEDPGPFKWTPELLAKGFTQEGFDKNGMMRFLFWQSKYGFDEACNRFEAYLKEQPLVVRTKRLRHGIGGGFSIRYWTKEGKEDGFTFLPPLSPEMRKTLLSRDPEEPLRIAAGMYRHLLDTGGAVFIGRGGSLYPPSQAARAVARIYDIVTSGLDDKAKIEALVKEDVNREEAEKLVVGLKANRELKDRIDKLTGEGR